MSEDYHHLTRDQRCQLSTLKKRGDSVSVIAHELGVHRSTVYREQKRNAGKRGYRFKQAHQKAHKRRHQASCHCRKMNPNLVALIELKLKIQWSPEQIAGWLKKQEHSLAVSYETIYQHIWRDKRNGGNLYKQLRHRGKKYNKRSLGKSRRG